jgi:Zn-finger nucleic acid-binding protein
LSIEVADTPLKPTEKSRYIPRTVVISKISILRRECTARKNIPECEREHDLHTIEGPQPARRGGFKNGLNHRQKWRLVGIERAIMSTTILTKVSKTRRIYRKSKHQATPRPPCTRVIWLDRGVVSGTFARKKATQSGRKHRPQRRRSDFQMRNWRMKETRLSRKKHGTVDKSEPPIDNFRGPKCAKTTFLAMEG